MSISQVVGSHGLPIWNKVLRDFWFHPVQLVEVKQMPIFNTSKPNLVVALFGLPRDVSWL
jgi:hypothetical protein